MRILITLAGVACAVAFAISAPAMGAQKQGSVDVQAKCQQMYPNEGNGQQRRTNAALRRQCVANGGK
jgi:uncharacterized protein (DUF4415 family)